MDSVIPLITSPIRWSITANACSTGRFGTRSRRRLLSRRINESVRSRRRWIPARAFVIRPRSARNGVVARLITTLPAAWASSATWGATPVPVPPPSPTVMKVRSASPIWFRSSCSEISAHRSPISGRPPAPMPRVTPPPIRSFRSAWMESRCTASVFTTTVRAPWMPMRWRRSTEFPPAPPHPTTTTFGLARANESRNDWFPVRCTVSRPIPGPSQAVPGGNRSARATEGRASLPRSYLSTPSMALWSRRRTYSRTAFRTASSTETESPDFTSC